MVGLVLLLLTCGHSNTVTEPGPTSSFPSPVDIAAGINVSEVALMHAYRVFACTDILKYKNHREHISYTMYCIEESL